MTTSTADLAPLPVKQREQTNLYELNPAPERSSHSAPPKNQCQYYFMVKSFSAQERFMFKLSSRPLIGPRCPARSKWSATSRFGPHPSPVFVYCNARRGGPTYRKRIVSKTKLPRKSALSRSPNNPHSRKKLARQSIAVAQTIPTIMRFRLNVKWLIARTVRLRTGFCWDQDRR